MRKLIRIVFRLFDDRQWPATEEEILEFQRQLAQISNDPNLVLTTAPHIVFESKFTLPSGRIRWSKYLDSRS